MCKACISNTEGRRYIFGLSYNDIIMEMTNLEKGCLTIDMEVTCVEVPRAPSTMETDAVITEHPPRLVNTQCKSKEE